MDILERERMVEEYWQQATMGLREETENIKENFQFYCGGDGQWDRDVLAQLDEDGKPHLSINKCKSTIDLLSGYQRKFRDSLNVFPRRGGTVKASKVLTHLGRHTMDVSRPNGDFVQSETFMMGALGGKWWSNLHLSYQWDQFGGDLQPESISCFDILEDPLYRGYDINSNDPFNFNRFVFRLRALTDTQLMLLYPDAREIIEGASAGIGVDNMFVLQSGPETITNSDYDVRSSGAWRPDYTQLAAREKRFWIRECWYKKFAATAFIQNTETQQVHNLGNKVKLAQELAKQAPHFTAVVRVLPTLNRCTYLGKLEIEHTEDPLDGLAEYPFFRFSPYWIDGKPLGELDNLKDPQRELNKRRSQLLHHLNSSANSGVLLEENSVDPIQLKNYQENLGSAGFVGIYKGVAPVQLQAANISLGHLKMAMLSNEDFEDITKLNDAVYGQTRGAKESGKALEQRRSQGLAVKEVAFDNFKFSELGFYSHLLERVRRPNKNGQYVYSDQEIMMLIEENDLDMDLETLRAMETGRYGMKIDRSELQPTVRRDNFVALLEMLRLAPMMAEEIDTVDILDASDLNNKDTLIEHIKARRMQMQQQAALTGQVA